MGAIDRYKLKLVDHFRRTNALDMYPDFMKSQWLSLDEIQALQWTRLTELLAHAYENVPYYREMFKAHGIQPGDIKSFTDYRKIPLLNKSILRENGERMHAKNKDLFEPRNKSTGGSTGRPLKYLMDRRSQSAHWAFLYRAWGVASWKPGDRVVVVGGTSLYPSAYALKKWFYVRLNNWMVLSAFGMNDAVMAEWIPRLRKWKAPFMYCYASSAYLLADYILRKGISDIRFDGVCTTSEVLQPRFRETIERAFQTKVYDTYGGADGAGFAFECENHNGLHIVAENSYVEILDDIGRPCREGEAGEIYSTDLFNYVMPFIRYDTGDIGVFDSSPCPCKRGLPRLRSILGRSCDFAVAPDGKKYHEEFFSYLFKEVPAVERFCVEQNSREELKINLCCARPLKTADREHIRSILGRHFNGMKIELAETRELPVQKSGKFRYIINNIPEEKA